MKIEFNVKYGKNVLDIPIPQNSALSFFGSAKTDFFTAKVTIYNDIPKDAVTPRHFDKHVIEKCNIQGGTAEKADGTVANIINSKTVTTIEASHFLPFPEYIKLPEDKRQEYFTANPDDFIVFGVVDDIVTTSAEMAELRKKYKNNGISITAVNPHIYGTSLDNIQMTGA